MISRIVSPAAHLSKAAPRRPNCHSYKRSSIAPHAVTHEASHTMATKRDSIEPTALNFKNQSIFVRIHETRLPCETAANWQTQQQTTSWATEDEFKIREPYNYIAELQGKNFRGNLIAALQSWIDFEKHRNAAQCFSAVSATLNREINALLIECCKHR